MQMEELMENWKLAIDELPLNKINPLEGFGVINILFNSSTIRSFVIISIRSALRLMES